MIRVFQDSTGVEWRVWSTHPASPIAVAVELRAGWLTFDSGTERRRVGPIPAEWETLSAQRLELMCRVAKRARDSDPSFIAPIDQDSEGVERPGLG